MFYRNYIASGEDGQQGGGLPCSSFHPDTKKLAFASFVFNHLTPH
jgi:hypothetical protein